MSEDGAGFTVQPATIDQMAGAVALTLGALGSLLLVIWQSRCLCRCRIGISDKCYLFDCSREPPPLEPGADAEQPAQTDAEDPPDDALIPPADRSAQPEPEPEP
jgi:hypothetical protein